jgi:cell division septum initiation protein DivIVA
MNVDELLDSLDEMIDKSWGIPGGRCFIDAEKAREIIDDIRLNLPKEIRQAKAIVSDRTEILKSAKAEADGIIKTAEDKAKILVSQDEIVKTAQQRAGEIIDEATKKSGDMKSAAADFVNDLLRTSEDNLNLAVGEVRQARQALKSTPKS